MNFFLFRRFCYPCSDVGQHFLGNSRFNLGVFIGQTGFGRLEKMGPAYPVNVNYLPSEDECTDVIDTENLNIITLFKNYLEQVEMDARHKDMLYDSFIELYNNYKEQGV